MEYIGRIECDRKLWENKEGIVIFGAGRKLEELLDRLAGVHVGDKVVCICDNNCGKQGKEIAGIRIVSPEYAFSHHVGAAYLVYNQFWPEICRQLAERGIKRIHLIRD